MLFVVILITVHWLRTKKTDNVICNSVMIDKNLCHIYSTSVSCLLASLYIISSSPKRSYVILSFCLFVCLSVVRLFYEQETKSVEVGLVVTRWLRST